MKTIRLLLAVLTVVVVNCSSPSDVAGVETVNTKTVVAKRTDGSPAAHATVRVVSYDKWYSLTSQNRSAILETTTTDANGQFSFDPDQERYVTLEITDDGEGAITTTAQLSGNPETDTIALQQLLSVTGNTQSADDTVALAGTSLRTPVHKHDGSFVFSNVPPGEYSALLISRQISKSSLLFAGSDSVFLGKLNSFGIALSSDTLPLSYFDKEWIATAIQPITRGGNWYSFTDSSRGGNSTHTRSFDSSYAGKALRIDAVLDSGHNRPYAGIGVNLGNPNDPVFRYFDLTNLKAIVFHAKGTPGTMAIAVNTHLTATSDKDWDRFRYKVNLEDTWQQFVIPVDSLAMTQEPKYAWSEAARKADLINFTWETPPGAQFPQSITVELDDVYLVGLTIDELMSDY